MKNSKKTTFGINRLALFFSCLDILSCLPGISLAMKIEHEKANEIHVKERLGNE